MPSETVTVTPTSVPTGSMFNVSATGLHNTTGYMVFFLTAAEEFVAGVGLSTTNDGEFSYGFLAGRVDTDPVTGEQTTVPWNTGPMVAAIMGRRHGDLYEIVRTTFEVV